MTNCTNVTKESFTACQTEILDKAERKITQSAKEGKRWFVFDHYEPPNQRLTDEMRKEIASRFAAAGWRTKIRYERDFGQGHGGYTLTLSVPKTKK